MGQSNLNSLDPRKFLDITATREQNIHLATDSLKSAELPANRLAARLHPKRQYMKVAEIVQQADGCRSFVLVPDTKRGTNECAYFSAGQYVSVFVSIKGVTTCRAYSIASSPSDAQKGFYRLIVKGVNGGLVSQYILNTWRIGSEVELSDPFGTFTYEPLRDAKHIVGIAGGSGITPFLSLAYAIADDEEDCSLTLLYGCRNYKSILMKDELDALSNICDKIKVIYVLSEEEKEGYEYGNITSDLIKRYASCESYSVFVCGSQAMYGYMKEECQKLGLERKYIRFEHFGEMHGNAGTDARKVQVTVTQQGTKKIVWGSTDDTLLQILEENGIIAPARCRSGECGFCNSTLLGGQVYVPENSDHRRLADNMYGHIHPCCTFPMSDIELEILSGK